MHPGNPLEKLIAGIYKWRMACLSMVLAFGSAVSCAFTQDYIVMNGEAKLD